MKKIERLGDNGGIFFSGDIVFVSATDLVELEQECADRADTEIAMAKHINDLFTENDRLKDLIEETLREHSVLHTKYKKIKAGKE